MNTVNTNSLVRTLKNNNDDYEWYPTTDEIIQAVKEDIKSLYRFDHDQLTILDCGAGDGRVLHALTKGKKIAIEKSRTHLNCYEDDIIIGGTDFRNLTLVDKYCDLIFSNPPYSDFKEWAQKIIREGYSNFIYLVLPVRWENNPDIQNAIADRSASFEILGEYSFLNAERQARGKVHLIRIGLNGQQAKRFQGRNTKGQISPNINPFHNWVENTFFTKNEKEHHFTEINEQENHTESNSMTLSKGVIKNLEVNYNQDMENLLNNYKSICSLDVKLLQELNVTKEVLINSIIDKVKGLKQTYWIKLFDGYSTITSRLTSSSRHSFKNTLSNNFSVDFTASNAYEVTMWSIRNSNSYVDAQLCDIVWKMTEKANIKKYKSNQKTFGRDEWIYTNAPQDLIKFYLEPRIVLTRCGGICTSEWSYKREKYNGLSETAATFLDDLATIANTLGFDSINKAIDFQWESGKKNLFLYKEQGKELELFEAKAFKNGNIHLKINSKLMCKLNVEYGRLKGWVKSAKEASEELNITLEDAQDSFNGIEYLGVYSTTEEHEMLAA